MTKHANRKQQARALAAELGISYTEALRRTQMQDKVLPHSATSQSPDEAKTYVIQQERRTDGVLPYPFEIGEHGLVGNQQFWKGDPLFLIGFEDRSPQAQEANRSTGGHDITIYRAEFLTDPESVVGLAPVFANYENKWASWTTPVASVTIYDRAPAEPKCRTVLATFMSVPDDDIDFTIDVGPYLFAFPDEVLAELSEVGWYDHRALDRLLDIAVADGNPDAQRAWDWVGEHDNGDEDDPARAYVSVMANPQQADAWIATHRPRVRTHTRVN